MEKVKYWSYRVMLLESADEKYLAIREVFFDENDNPIGYSEENASVLGENVEDLKEVLNKFSDVFNKPILKEKDLKNN